MTMPYGVLADSMDFALWRDAREDVQRGLLALVSAKRMKYGEYSDRMREFDHPVSKKTRTEIDEMVQKTIAADKKRRK